MTRPSGSAAGGVVSGLVLIAFGVSFLLDPQRIVDARHRLQTAVVSVGRHVFPILLLGAGVAAVREGLPSRPKPRPVSDRAEEKP